MVVFFRGRIRVQILDKEEPDDPEDLGASELFLGMDEEEEGNGLEGPGGGKEGFLKGKRVVVEKTILDLYIERLKAEKPILKHIFQIGLLDCPGLQRSDFAELRAHLYRVHQVVPTWLSQAELGQQSWAEPGSGLLRSLAAKAAEAFRTLQE